MRPLARIDCASSSSFSSAKNFRGCAGLGSIWSMPSSRRSLSTDTVGLNSALSPLPRAFFDMMISPLFVDDFFSKPQITLRAFRFDVVQDCRLAITRRFGQANVARDD